MVTSYDALAVDQLCFRRLEGPDESGGIVGLGLAGVDLNAISLQLEEEDGPVGRGQVVRDGLGIHSLGSRCSGEPHHHGEGGKDAKTAKKRAAADRGY